MRRAAHAELHARAAVTICWTSRCWVTIHETARPTSNCGAVEFRGGRGANKHRAISLFFTPDRPFCVGQDTGGRAGGRQQEVKQSCGTWLGCARRIEWTIRWGDQPALGVGTSVCGVKIVKPPYTLPRIAAPSAPSGHRSHPVVAGTKFVKPRRAALAVLLSGRGSWLYQEGLGRDDGPVSASSAIDTPPPRHVPAAREWAVLMIFLTALAASAATTFRARTTTYVHGAHAYS